MKRFDPLGDMEPEQIAPRVVKPKRNKRITVVERPRYETIISPPAWSKASPPNDGAVPLEEWLKRGYKAKDGQSGRTHRCFIPLDDTPNPKYEAAAFTVFTQEQVEPVCRETAIEEPILSSVVQGEEMPLWRRRLFRIGMK